MAFPSIPSLPKPLNRALKVVGAPVRAAEQGIGDVNRNYLNPAWKAFSQFDQPDAAAIRSLNPNSPAGLVNWAMLLGPSRVGKGSMIESVDPGGKYLPLPYNFSREQTERRVLTPFSHDYGTRVINIRGSKAANAPILGSLVYIDPRLNKMPPGSQFHGLAGDYTDPIYVETAFIQPKYRNTPAFFDFLSHVLKTAGPRGFEAEIVNPVLATQLRRMIDTGKIPGHKYTNYGTGGGILIQPVKTTNQAATDALAHRLTAHLQDTRDAAAHGLSYNDYRALIGWPVQGSPGSDPMDTPFGRTWSP